MFVFVNVVVLMRRRMFGRRSRLKSENLSQAGESGRPSQH